MGARKPVGGSDLALDAREVEILRSIIREHVLTGEPIGSRTLSQGTQIDLSPASIRSVMAALEQRGLLTQPHTSAGRVPTPKAYRVYVDQMMHRTRIAASDAQQIDQALLRSRGEIAELLAEASRQLSRFSHQVGVVLAPELRRLVVERLEFVRLDARRVVAILVGRSGTVSNRILDMREPLEQDELDRIGRYLSTECGGRTLPDMLGLLRQRMAEERAAYDRLMARSLELGRQTLEAEVAEAGVFVDGASNLLGSPEFSELERVKSLVKLLEEKKTLIELLGRVLESGGVQVVIGDEYPASQLGDCSLVASSYGIGERVMGTVGIVGPTRMEYARAIALVDYLAQVLTRLLSGPGN